MMRLNSTANSSSSNDDELTNLTWLQDNNLLQNMTHNESDESTSSEASGRVFKEDDENLSPKPTSAKAAENKKTGPESNVITTSSGITIPRSVAPVRYDPLFHTQTKPPYSFSSLIFMAIESSPIKALPVKDIYAWIAKNFPFYKMAPDGWKNTVRHNLSLNKCFQKIEKGKRHKDSDQDQLDDQLSSKGSLWCVDPELRPNLLQSIKKTPAGYIYPYMSTAKTGTNLVQISNIINSTSDNQPNGNQTSQIAGNAVAIGNHISPSNNFINQSPGKKIITLEKLPQKNILTTAKRVLIPITKKVGREPEEADAAESMLTLTQCSTAGSLNNGNIYIITNKGENFLPTFQLNAKPAIITGAAIKPQQTPVKNKIAILTQPIIQTVSSAAGTGTIAFAAKPVVGVAGKPTPTIKDATVIPVSASQLVSNAPTDHNYFNRSSAVKTISNVITIPASSLASVAGQPILVNSGQTAGKSNLIISSSNIKTVGNNRIITITANPSPVKQNIVIKSPVKADAVVQQPEQSKPPPNKKQKVVEDEDGLKCAEALFNLANGTVKLAKSPNVEKKTTASRAEKDQPAASGKSKLAAQAVPTPSSTITRSTAKKLKASV